MNLAIEYIEKHLDEQPTVEEIAAAACFSPFHFHRIFRAFTGEPVASYRRRLLLNRAALHLLQRPASTVEQVALDHGFSTASDFARSFRRQFRLSPSAYRRQGGASPRESSPRKPSAERFRAGWIRRVERSVTIETGIDLRLAYVRCTGLSPAFKSRRIADAFARLYRWARARGYLDATVRPYGIYLDNPEVTPLQECRYLACLAVRDEAQPEDGFGIREVPAGRGYVRYRFLRVSPFFVRRFFRVSLYLYRHWIPCHGLLPSDSPIMEAYRLSGKRARHLDLLLPIE